MPYRWIQMGSWEMYNWHSKTLIPHSVPPSKSHQELQFKGQYTGAHQARHLQEVLYRFELTHSRLLGITTDNSSSNHSTTQELQSTPAARGMEWPTLRNYIACMVYVIQHASGAFMNILGVEGPTESWKGHVDVQRFGKNESRDIWKSHRLGTEGNARINMVSAMRPGLAKIRKKVLISRYFESAETDLHIAKNA